MLNSLLTSVVSPRDANLRLMGGGRSAAASATGMAGQMFRRILDEIDYGLMLVAAGGTLRYANRAAMQVLQAGAPLTLGEGQTLAAAVQTDELRVAVEGALKGRRRLVSLGDGQACLSVAVVPLHSALIDGEEPVALVVLGKQAQSPTLSVDFFGHSHGLTSAELNVLKQMTLGLDPRNIADALGVAISTVRSHITHIRNKTETNSIRELLLRVSNLPPIKPVMPMASSVMSFAQSVAGLASPPVAASAPSGPPWGQVNLGSGPATDLRPPAH
jgi:DNA-binding CsgD family transcriptional regulator